MLAFQRISSSNRAPITELSGAGWQPVVPAAELLIELNLLYKPSKLYQDIGVLKNISSERVSKQESVTEFMLWASWVYARKFER